MTTALALPEPATITPAQIPEYCRAVEAEALATDDKQIAEEIYARWSAITQYLAVKSRDGIAQAKATELRLLARIGELTPPDRPGRKPANAIGPDRNAPPALSPMRMAEARHLAAHPDIVEDVIAEGTDEAPPTKAQVIRRIRETRPPRPLTEEQRAAREVEQANDRARDRLRQLVIGWIELVGLPGRDRRDQILAGLIDHDRQRVLEIEAVYLHWKASHA